MREHRVVEQRIDELLHARAFRGGREVVVAGDGGRLVEELPDGGGGCGGEQEEEALPAPDAAAPRETTRSRRRCTASYPEKAVESRDTDARAHRAQLDAYRAMGPARRVRMAIEMSERARRLSIRGMQSRLPGISGAEARARVLRQILGDELFEAAWPGA